MKNEVVCVVGWIALAPLFRASLYFPERIPRMCYAKNLLATFFHLLLEQRTAFVGIFYVQSLNLKQILLRSVGHFPRNYIFLRIKNIFTIWTKYRKRFIGMRDFLSQSDVKYLLRTLQIVFIYQNKKMIEKNIIIRRLLLSKLLSMIRQILN